MSDKEEIQIILLTVFGVLLSLFYIIDGCCELRHRNRIIQI